MKQDWPLRPLGEVCEIKGGGTPSKDEKSFYQGSIPWATVRDMKGEIISSTECMITEEAVAKSSTNIVSANNVVIATRVGLGKVCLIQQDTAINQDLRGVIPKNEKNLLVRYLYWWLKSVSHKIEEAGTGATVKGVKLPFVKSLLIPVPERAEQQRIVAILDEAFAGIATATANAEKNLQNARELFESTLQSVFAEKRGGVEKRLGDAVVKVSTGPFGSLLHKSDYVSEGVPLVNPINIVNDVIVPDSRKMVNSGTQKRLQTYLLNEGDIVIARRGEIGRCAVVTKEQSGWICGTGCFFIKPSSELDPNFLVRLLRSSSYRDRLEAVATGATMKNISNKALSELMVSFPSRQEQTSILNRIHELEVDIQRLHSIYKQKISKFGELKQSILQKAFAGELH